MIEHYAMRTPSTLLVVNESLKLPKELNGTLEADRSRLNVVLRCGLRHDRADEIVSENVRPNLFAHQLRRLAAQNVHLQGLFHIP